MQLYHFFLSHTCRGANIGMSPETVMCVEAVCCLAYLYTQHRYEPRPSAFFSIYLAVGATVRASLAWLDVNGCYRNSNGLPVRGEVALRVVMLCLHETCKQTDMLNWAWKDLTADACYGWWTRTTGLWIVSSLRLASRGLLTAADLVSSGTGLSTQSLAESFETSWEDCKLTAKSPIIFSL